MIVLYDDSPEHDEDVIFRLSPQEQQQLLDYFYSHDFSDSVLQRMFHWLQHLEKISDDYQEVIYD